MEDRMSDGIVAELVNDIAWVVRIDRPQRRNALGGPTWSALRDAILAAPKSARAIVVTGSDKVFSAGMDLKPDNPLLLEVAQAIGNQDANALKEIIHMLKGCIAPLREAGIPTIAAIEGPCLGGGLEIALHCDVRIASQTTVLAMPEPRLGFVADIGGTTLLHRLIGPGRASWLITSGRRIDIDTAEQWGLVEQRCEAGTALSTALELVTDMAKGAPVATRASLALLRDETESLDQAFEAETAAGVDALLAGEVMEAIQARMQGRAAAWAPSAG
jgi:enoyl-CoA hydratase/carnithine racemase